MCSLFYITVIQLLEKIRKLEKSAPLGIISLNFWSMIIWGERKTEIVSPTVREIIKATVVKCLRITLNLGAVARLR